MKENFKTLLGLLQEKNMEKGLILRSMFDKIIVIIVARAVGSPTITSETRK